ncbi:hypothetical protein T4B_9442 [Trichinella pseudospiralis]|uniref:Uncharacterized protein n=1 Tax=Trichinella pseudospiralis TaxID=6337 RepID=A0A0V1DY92_TRIPS|nr:hypothetical protein T4A_3315 [Trichinella pseudospiralis]KRZ21745.1 hypothetical protein T4B_9442 [Trichinella pseudospiralis]
MNQNKIQENVSRCFGQSRLNIAFQFNICRCDHRIRSVYSTIWHHIQHCTASVVLLLVVVGNFHGIFDILLHGNNHFIRLDIGCINFATTLLVRMEMSKFLLLPMVIIVLSSTMHRTIFEKNNMRRAMLDKNIIFTFFLLFFLSIKQLCVIESENKMNHLHPVKEQRQVEQQQHESWLISN